MFFYLSKILWLATAPSNVLVVVTLVAIVVVWTSGPWLRRAACRTALAGSLGLAAVGFLPLGVLLLAPLEARFPRPDLTGLEPAAIIVLGGAVDEEIGLARDEVHLVGGAERLTAGVALSRQFPGARLVYSGQSGALLRTTASEADYARRLWISLGVDASRIVIENRSRNTYENAQFTRDLLQPAAGQRFILVTSAYHMPRSVGLFRTAGFDVVPYPVDHRTKGTLADLVPLRQASDGLGTFDTAVREWIGLVAYRLTGKIDTLLPGP